MKNFTIWVALIFGVLNTAYTIYDFSFVGVGLSLAFFVMAWIAAGSE